MATVPIVTSCNTCKASFASTDLIREHYRHPWHVFNSKRRANGLPSITEIEFRKAATAQAAKKQALPQKYSPSVSAMKQKAPVTVFRASAQQPTQPLPKKVDSSISESMETADDQVSDINDDEEQQEDEREIMCLPTEPNISIFDNTEHESVEACLEYMEKNFSFYIPDKQYLTDLPGFLTYLNEKVKIGGLCLFCQKQFQPGYAVQSHMISKSHCKIAFDDDEDEFEDFYDYTSSYEGIADEDLGEVTINALGEMVLPDGRTVGHREFRRFYKQNFRPEETRDSVLVVKREYLLQMGQTLGQNFKNEFKSTDLVNLTNREVMTLIIQKQKELKRVQQVQYRDQRKAISMTQRREYQSQWCKVKDRETTTDKIRDYHGMLK